ncbi:hypothetical protein TYRP_004849 [Tyrophagus putrescentiae]|nr:hypothetical protein TYRP_004849 [Tyrophagus putrescentiae]
MSEWIKCDKDKSRLKKRFRTSREQSHVTSGLAAATALLLDQVSKSQLLATTTVASIFNYVK